VEVEERAVEAEQVRILARSRERIQSLSMRRKQEARRYNAPRQCP